MLPSLYFRFSPGHRALPPWRRAPAVSTHSMRSARVHAPSPDSRDGVHTARRTPLQAGSPSEVSSLPLVLCAEMQDYFASQVVEPFQLRRRRDVACSVLTLVCKYLRLHNYNMNDSWRALTCVSTASQTLIFTHSSLQPVSTSHSPPQVQARQMHPLGLAAPSGCTRSRAVSRCCAAPAAQRHCACAPEPLRNGKTADGVRA